MEAGHGDEPQAGHGPGWYEFQGGFRYWDGGQWTEHFGPPHPPMLTQRQIASAVLVGALAAFFVVWMAAQLAPDTFYVPVKFVVKDLPHIPSGLGY
jgi:hypothetical protein